MLLNGTSSTGAGGIPRFDATLRFVVTHDAVNARAKVTSTILDDIGSFSSSIPNLI